ncbi:hypothetical protein BYT27DRAFT_7260429 [Phlegmacium glaucopus]|nr:hypothetical protein BYT27DRAFT_7260429 [Phlegmacium glaucopus]
MSINPFSACAAVFHSSQAQEGPTSQTTATASNDQYVYIRVRQSLLLPVPPPENPANLPPTNIPLPNAPSTHLYLIKDTIQDIEQFAGATVERVIKVAHLIYAPFWSRQSIYPYDGHGENNQAI